MSFLPVWQGDEFFVESLDQFVRQPYAEPNAFQPGLNPVRRLVLVYGRPGVGKKEAIKLYCDNAGVPSGVVTVEFARTAEAITQIQHVIVKQDELIKEIDAAMQHDHGPRINHAIIIDRFDKLIFEPDNEATMLFMLNLSRTAQDHNLMFICLSDRLASEESHANLPQTTRLYRQAIFEQFKARAYLGAPSSSFRQVLFRTMIERFVAFANGQSSRGDNTIVLTMTDDDYVKLADFSAFATSEDIAAFLRAVFYDIASYNAPVLCRPITAPTDPTTGKPCGPISLNMNVLESYMSSGTGSLHIMSMDPRIIENKYSVESGRGPIAGMKPVQSRGPQVPDLEHTKFSTSFVDPNVAESALVSKSERKQKRKAKREREAEEVQLWKDEGSGSASLMKEEL